MANIVYNRARRRILQGSIVLSSATIKVMLLEAGYTPDKDHDFVSSVNSFEAAGTGYVGGFAGAGRKTVSNKIFTEDDSNDRAYMTGDSITWTGLNFGTIVAVVLIQEVTNDADSELLSYFDTAGLPLVTNGGDVTITINAAGLLQIA